MIIKKVDETEYDEATGYVSVFETDEYKAISKLMPGEIVRIQCADETEYKRTQARLASVRRHFPNLEVRRRVRLLTFYVKAKEV